MRVFNRRNYRDIVRDEITASKETTRPFTFQRLAERIGIQPPYFTKVMNGDADLSTDQGFLLCRAFAFKKLEEEYFLLLLDAARTGLEERRSTLMRAATRIRDENLAVKNQVSAPHQEDSGRLMAYYADPYHVIVHMALTVRRWARNPNLLADRLQIDERRLEAMLETLISLQLIKRGKSGEVSVINDHFHLPKDSVFYRLQRTSLKQLGNLKFLADGPAKHHNLDVTFTADEETIAEIKLVLLRATKQIERKVRDAPADGVFQFGFELFRWT